MGEVPSCAGSFLIQEDDNEEIINSNHRGILSEQTYHEIAPDNDNYTDKYFGSNVLNCYQELQSAKDLGMPNSIIELYQESLKITVNRSKNLLASYCKGDAEEKDMASALIKTIFRNKDFRVAYDNYYNKYAKRVYEVLGLENKVARLNSVEEVILSGSFIFPNIPDDLYLKMLLEYQKAFELKALDTRKRLDEFYDNELPDLVRGFANTQGLNEEELVRRLSDSKKRLKLSFNDSKTMVFDSFAKTNARGGVSIDPFLRFENVLKPVFTHEVIHNISGRLYRVWKVKNQDLFFDFGDFEEEDIESSEYIYNYVVPEKSGFNFLNSFGWLNEGCTDLATLRIFKSNYMAVGYNDEIELIEKILKEGKIKISEQLLFKAYFESYDENLPLNQQLPYVKQFFSETSKSFAPGFLGKLSSFIDVYSDILDEQQDVIGRINENFPQIVEIFSSREPRNVRESKAIALLYPEEGEKLLDNIENGGTYTSGT